MKKIITFLSFIVFISIIVSPCSQNDLTEERAKKAVDELLAQGPNLSDNKPPYSTLILWQGLLKDSENENYAPARIKHMNSRLRELSGQFIFHKNTEDDW